MPRLRTTTHYLIIDTRLCSACGECVSACPRAVLRVCGIQRILNDRHVHVVAPDDCNGCLACVEACASDALAGRENIGGPAS